MLCELRSRIAFASGTDIEELPLVRENSYQKGRKKKKNDIGGIITISILNAGCNFAYAA